MKKLSVRAALLTSTLASGLLLTVPAAAQIVPGQDDDLPRDEAGNVEAPVTFLEEGVVITGTRLNNPNLEQASPVAVITAEEINLRQVSVAEEFLREIPGITPSIGGQVNNGNGGNTFVDLRGIGANRNLTLLNGTRVVPAGLGGVTNIDVIPVALLERVDVLTGGASATYGADAISGVVNFITKDDFAGIDFTVLQQITEEGDGNILRGDLTLGANFEDGRGNAVFSAGYTERDALFQGDRSFGRENINSLTGLPGGSSTAVPSVLAIPGIRVTTNPVTGRETSTNTLQVSPDGSSLIPFDRPFNFNPFNLYQLPLEQFRVYGKARYEISDSIEVFSEGLFVQSTNSTIIAPSGTFRNVLTVPLSNPFLPAGIRNQICGRDTSLFIPDNPATPDVNEERGTRGVQRLFTQAQCDAAALATNSSDPNFRTVDVDFGRRFVEFGPRTNEYETQLFQIKAGLRANLVSNLDFEVFGAYGENENDSRQSGNGTLSRLQQSVLSTNPTTCLDPSNGCVPINLFGPLGSLDPTGGVQSFLDIGNTSKDETSLAQAQAFISGDVGVRFPGTVTPVSIVVGAEFREYTAQTRSDILTQTPGEVLGNGAASPDAFGRYEVYEGFGELAVPLIEDSFITEATLLLGGRVSDYSTTGTEYTYKLGGTITPFEGLQFRGNYQQVTRAPNIGELFAPQVTGLDNFDSDPCAGAGPTNNANLQAICLAQGAPTNSIGGIIVDPAGQINFTQGGNPNLAAENAKTFTIGAILQPRFVPGLSITVDYYNIDLKDAITSPTIDDAFAACFGVDFRTAPGGLPTDPACLAIRRNPASGNLFGSVATTPGIPLLVTNQGRIKTDGIDLVANYRRDLGFASAVFNFAGNWTNSNTFDANQDDPANVVFECAGFFGTNCGSIIPEFSFNQRTTLEFGGVAASLLWRYLDEVNLERSVFNAAGQAPFVDDFETIGDEHYFDLSFRVNASDNLTLTAAALNLTDNKPKVVGSNIGGTAFNSGNIFPSSYDPIGRRYSVTAKLSF